MNPMPSRTRQPASAAFGGTWIRRALLAGALVLWIPAGSLAAPALPAPAAPGAYIPDIATFLQIGACGPAGFSWDGKDVYFTSTMSGAPQVYRLTAEGWPYQLTTFEDGIDGFDLSWDARSAIVSASVGGDENAQLYLMETASGRIQKLTNKPDVQYGSVTWAPDDRAIYCRSNEENGTDFFIYRMEIPSGRMEKVFGAVDAVKGSNAVADLSRDGSTLIVSHATSNVNNDLYVVDLKTGSYNQLTSDTRDITYDSVTLHPDNRTLTVVCNDNPDGLPRLAVMTVGSPKVSYVTDGWLDPKWEVEGAGYTRDFKIQVAVLNEDGYSRLKMRDAESRAALPNPPLDGILGGPMFDQNGNCILQFSSPTRAPDVWRWNPRTKELKQLTFSIYAGIDRTMFREPQLIRYKSFDGLEIPAFLYLPPNYRKGEPVPFVVDAHGGPEGQFRPDFIRNFQYLMLNGYGILAPNPRGSSGYGIHYLALDDYKKRKDSLKDYKAGVDWLVANGYTKPGMIGIRGGSYGGYVVLGMITEYPKLFNAAIDIVGIANFVTFLKNTAPYRRAIREAEYGPLSDEAFLKSISPLHKANVIETPLLVVHGANDPRVPVSEARQILAAVRANGGMADSLIFADEGHGASKRSNSIAEYRKHVAFFDQFLKPKEWTKKKE